MAAWYRLHLTAEEKEQLRSTIEKRKTSANQVLFAIAENGINKTDIEVAGLCGISTRSIERLRKCCCEEGLEMAL